MTDRQKTGGGERGREVSMGNSHAGPNETFSYRRQSLSEGTDCVCSPGSVRARLVGDNLTSIGKIFLVVSRCLRHTERRPCF